MWVQVRSFDGKKSVRVDGLSKLTKVEDFRKRLVELFDADPERQRLFYRGKQMVDGHTLFDYNVGLNEIVQIMIRPVLTNSDINCNNDTAETEDANGNSSGDESCCSEKENKKESVVREETEKHDLRHDNETSSSLYKIGDLIDVRDNSTNAWFEGTVKKITEDFESHSATVSHNGIITSVDLTNDTKSNITDGFLYHVTYDAYPEDGIVQFKYQDIRPRARKLLSLSEVNIGDIVMANYNYDEPNERGYWYDVEVAKVCNTRTIKLLFGSLHIGENKAVLKDCKIQFINEIFKIEKPDSVTPHCSPVKRLSKPECDHCGDSQRRKCKHCGCSMCGGKNDPGKQILCDECDDAYHIYCLNPPLETIPDEEEWYCPLCKNDSSEVVQAGEKLKESKKKSNMASAKTTSSRDWGKGMACVGRMKECRIVPPNHFGPIPGIEVGMIWKFRVGASEAGVHRPHVAGIHGREHDGAYSIVLSGGYEDDEDCGDSFTYTGSGGRDLSGNKRTAEQSSDQLLTRMNLALAKNCYAKVDAQKGADAGDDWQLGKPVRVVRNCKGKKHSKYAPEDGNRYDGIYKVVKYWKAKGQSGFNVWRYLLRRDDSTPAPWTKTGQKRIKNLGIEMQYPDGYLEAVAAKEIANGNQSADKEELKTNRKRKSKINGVREEPPQKKSKPAKKYEVSPEIHKLVKLDECNRKLWDECLKTAEDGQKQFLSSVEEHFSCICCQDIAVKPITTKCLHNVCQPCLKRSFAAEVFSCPACRTELGKDYSLTSNKNLVSILNKLFPGYESGR